MANVVKKHSISSELAPALFLPHADFFTFPDPSLLLFPPSFLLSHFDSSRAHGAERRRLRESSPSARTRCGAD